MSTFTPDLPPTPAPPEMPPGPASPVPATEPPANVPAPLQAQAIAPPEPREPTPPPAADPAQVEAMVAAVGLQPFLDVKLRKVFLHHIDRAAKSGDEIDRKIYLFLGRAKPEPTRPLPPWDFEAARASVESTPLPQHDAAVIEAFGDLYEAGYAAIQLVERIRVYLAQKAPHRRHRSIAWDTETTPPHSEVARWRRLWNLAIDPLSILDDLNEYAVSRDMVTGLSEMYPLLWKRIDTGVDAQLMRKRSVEPKYQLSIRKEQLLRVLAKREDATSKAMGIALQAQFAAMAAAAAPKPPTKKVKGGASSESTASDRIS